MSKFSTARGGLQPAAVRSSFVSAFRFAVEVLEDRRLMSVAPFRTALQAAFAGDADRLSSDLLTNYFRTAAAAQKTSAVTKALSAVGGSDVATYVKDPSGRLGVVVTAVDVAAVVPKLKAMGMVVAAALPAYHRIEGFLPRAALVAASKLGGSGLLGITAVPKVVTYAGTVNSQADNVLEADRVRASVPGYDGTGVKIGVISDSYNKYSASPASSSISSGNLPANVQVLQDYTAAATDEGRAMLELIYDLAPGASLGFATANISEAGFASNIRALASAGYKVIVDDVGYYDEPFFQDGIVAQAVNDVVAGGASYFSAAGNSGNLSYDSGAAVAYGSGPLNFASQTITPINSSASSYYDWSPAATVDTQMRVGIPRGSTVYLNFQWDQPYYTTNGVTTNLDFYLVSTDTTTGVQTVRASVTTDNVTNQTPWALLTYTNTLSATANATTVFDVVVRNTNGGPVPGRIKFVDAYGDGAVTYPEYFTYSSTIVGHPAAAGAMAVGAAPFFDQTTPESFSSVGPSPILFNADGTRKPTAEVRAKPDVLAIDGTDTSFFGSDVEGNGYRNFFGTSAAAPHAAAVAALVLQANPTFTPSQIYARLKSTADATVGGGDANVIGSGLIDAYRAVFGGPVAISPSLSDGFESGALGNDWQVYKQGAGSVQVTSALSPAAGSRQLVLGANIGFGSSGFAFPELNEAILHANLAGRSRVVLSFSEKDFSNESDSPMPASFAGHGNYDGVAMSVDGVNWYRLLTLSGASSTTTFQTLTVDVSAAAASLGLTLSADTRIKFQQYGPTSFAPGVTGIALDNVALYEQTRISAVAVDDAGTQRSRVRSLTVQFAGAVTTAPASAFSLVRSDDGATIPVSVTVLSGGTQALLTFGGATLDSGSLSDGRYVLSVNGSAIVDTNGRAVDADGNGLDGGTGTTSLFRFFGDANGDAVVDAGDYLAFLTAYRTGNAAGGNSAYDFDGDGAFAASDVSAFLARFNKRRLP